MPVSSQSAPRAEPRHAAFALHNARGVFAREVRATSLLIRDEIIESIGGPTATAAHSIDCQGDFVLPGLIELHTDNLERHLKPRPGTAWNAARAILSHDAELAAAGITTAWDAISLGNDLGADAMQSTYLDEITAIVSAGAERLLRVDHHLHFRCELSSPHLQRHLERAGRVGTPRLVSLMDHTPGQGQWTDIERFRKHYGGRYDLEPQQLDALIARRQQTRLQFAAENRRAALDFARRRSCVLASHDDTGVASIEQSYGDSCTLAEFPTSLEAARSARERGMFVIAGAPNLVRGGSHSGNVAVAELVRADLCDILSSDYYPASLLQAVFMLARDFALPLHDAVARGTILPARALRLVDRGSIEEGHRADLVRVRETSCGPVVIAVWSAGRQVA
jgi:alpha-D-ribose 1-methylphosphonate 5-triphosphate diphosphatase